MTETNEILTAISKAMGSVHSIKRTGKNTHDNYSFASVDDFLAMVNPILAEAGLMVSMDETGLEDFTRKGKFGDNAWMRVRYLVTVFHSSGQSLPAVARTVEVLRNGAQAYGSAQSYVLKQFLRCLLLIPTGDKDDADLQATDAGEVTPVRSRTVSRSETPHDPQTGEVLEQQRQAFRDSLDKNPAQAASAGLRDAFIDGIKDSMPFDCTDLTELPPSQLLQYWDEVATVLVTSFAAKKSAKGVSAQWDKRDDLIMEMQEVAPVAYHRVLDAFNARMNEFRSAADVTDFV